MLAEFFLTPDAFCESDAGLRQLERCLFSFNPKQPSVALISRLNEDQWTQAMGAKISGIQNQNHRYIAMALFERICDEITVVRPSSGNCPSSEDSWIKRVKRSKQELDIDGIVVSNNVAISTTECTKLTDFLLPEFWSDYGNPRLVGRERNLQSSVLRSFCAFAEWIVIRMPQIRGGSDDEIVTVKQVVQLATSLPDGYRKSNIEVQFPLSEPSRNHPDRVFRSVKAELQDFAVSDAELRMTMLPVGSFINREILGGEYTSVSSGEKRQRARWLMTMNHVAIGGGGGDDRDDANSWNLYSRRDANKRLEKLTAIEPLRSEILQG